MTRSVARLTELSLAVRESSLKRLRTVPEGFENRRIDNAAMSFADTVQHLIDADNWLFEKVRVQNLDPITGKAGTATIESRDGYNRLLDELELIGKQRAEFIAGLTEDQLSELIFDARYGRKVSVWWIIARGNLDHETHHRGQIVAWLRILGHHESPK